MLVNLPDGCFRTPQLKPCFARFAKHATLRKRSWNNADEIVKDLAWADAVLMWSWPTTSAELLANCPNLRFAAHINQCREGALAEIDRGIAVTEARRGWSPAVAEMGLTLILNGLRKISDYHSAFRTGTEKWVKDFPADIDPLERQLTGRSVGLIGLGGIGQRLAELLQPFHTDLLTYDPYVPEAIAKRLGARKAPLRDVIRKSEVVVLCAAQTPETVHLFGAKEVALLQKNALFVNICRSSLVDMPALIARLQKGDITAMLDVFDKEPLEKDSILRKLPNVFCTSHRAGAPLESVTRILNMLADDFDAWLAGKKMKHVLTRDMMMSLG
jgi:phosphoglycerate dehydrogenase-like enzyme